MINFIFINVKLNTYDIYEAYSTALICGIKKKYNYIYKSLKVIKYNFLSYLTALSPETGPQPKDRGHKGS